MKKKGFNIKQLQNIFFIHVERQCRINDFKTNKIVGPCVKLTKLFNINYYNINMEI